MLKIADQLARVDELAHVFTNMKAKLLQDHDPRIKETEEQLRMIAERCRDIENAQERMGQRVDQIEEVQKEQEMVNSARIQTVESDNKEFCLNVIRDMEYMEMKLIEAVQKDTILII